MDEISGVRGGSNTVSVEGVGTDLDGGAVQNRKWCRFRCGCGSKIMNM